MLCIFSDAKHNMQSREARAIASLDFTSLDGEGCWNSTTMESSVLTLKKDKMGDRGSFMSCL